MNFVPTESASEGSTTTGFMLDPRMKGVIVPASFVNTGVRVPDLRTLTPDDYIDADVNNDEFFAVDHAHSKDPPCSAATITHRSAVHGETGMSPNRTRASEVTAEIGGDHENLEYNVSADLNTFERIVPNQPKCGKLSRQPDTSHWSECMELQPYTNSIKKTPIYPNSTTGMEIQSSHARHYSVNRNQQVDLNLAVPETACSTIEFSNLFDAGSDGPQYSQQPMSSNDLGLAYPSRTLVRVPFTSTCHNFSNTHVDTPLHQAAVQVSNQAKNNKEDSNRIITKGRKGNKKKRTPTVTAPLPIPAGCALPVNHRPARGRGRARQLKSMTEEQLSIETTARVEKNRAAARTARLRKKFHTEILERRVNELEQKDIRSQSIIAQLKQQLRQLHDRILELK